MTVIRGDVFPAPLMVAVVLCVLQARVNGDDAFDRLENVAEDTVATESGPACVNAFVPPIDEVERNPQPTFKPDPEAESLKDRWREALGAVEEGIAEEFDDFELVQEMISHAQRPSPHDSQYYNFRFGNDYLLIDIMFFDAPQSAGEYLRTTASLIGPVGMTVLQESGDEAYLYGSDGSGSLLMCSSNVYLLINATSSDLKRRAARVIADELERVVEDKIAAQTGDSPPAVVDQAAEPPERDTDDNRDDTTDNPPDSSVGDEARRPLSFPVVPPIDEVERDLNPQFESDPDAQSIKDRWRDVLNAVNEGLSEEFDNLELVRELVSDLRRPSPHIIYHYRYRLGNHDLSIDFCFFETPQRAGEFLRTGEVSSDVGFTILQELGDEAYQYGTSRTLLMCYSNVFVDVRAVPSDLILRSARVIADALEKVGEETVAEDSNR